MRIQVVISKMKKMQEELDSDHDVFRVSYLVECHLLQNHLIKHLKEQEKND